MSTHHHDDLFYRLEGQMQDMVFIGPVTEGIRMNGHFAGRLTHGELAGATFTLVDYFRLRPDGVGVVDAREVVEFEGQRVSVTVTGYVLPPHGLPVPTLTELTAPGFAFPDVPFAIEAAATFQTGAPALSHLNRTVVGHTGSVNLGTGELVVEARLITATTTVAA